MIRRDGEIFGLYSSNNGQSCTLHGVCGEHLLRNDLVTFKSVVVPINGKNFDSISVHKISDGTESCRVGYIQQPFIDQWKDNIDGFAQILELYENSPNTQKRSKSRRNCGMASFTLLDDIPVFE